MEINRRKIDRLEKFLQDSSFHDWANQVENDNYSSWEDYLINSPSDQEIAKIGKLIVKGIKFKPENIDPEIGQQSLERLKVTLRQEKEKSSKTFRLASYRQIVKRWSAAAAILAIVSVTSLWYYQSSQSSQFTFSTNYGEQKKLELPDGSKVTLNANSTLKYDRRTARNVSLEGEAYFQIEKKPSTNALFEVHTSDLLVEVLGTTFNVNTRNAQTEVFLEEGKVKLKVDDIESHNIEMDPGDLVTYSKKLNRVQEKNEKTSVLEVSSWKDGILLFNKTPLIQVVSEIQEVYGIKFEFEADDLDKETLSGGIPSNDLDVTLGTLKDIYGIQIEEVGDAFIIKGKID